MAYNALNNLIDAYIYANGAQAITGQILNGVLKQMVAQLGSGYHLMGVAGPETVPASNDYAMAYFAATAGEYTDFGGITLAAGEVAVLLTSGNGSWEKRTIYNVPTGTADLENTAGFITNAVMDLVNYYTKTEVDTTLADYPTLEALATALADYYTKQEIDEQKAETDAALADRYTKTETDTKLGGYYKKTETYDKDEVDSIVASLSRQEYIVAWDGLAAPDVSAIPAGVTVTYSGTTYTGTLAASASTVNKIYMVWNGVAYDMYGSSQDGGYSWVPMGTTSVDLSQYATKAELSQLQQKLYETREYGTITGKYISGSSWISLSSSVSKYIKLKAGDEIHIVKNSTKDAYVAFLTSVDTSTAPTFTNGTSSVLRAITDSTFQVINDCYLWWLVDYDSSQHFEPSVLTLNGVDILTSTYAIDILAEIGGDVEALEGDVEALEGDVEALEGDVDGANNRFTKMVGLYQPAGNVPADWGTVVAGKYWNLVNGIAGMVSAANYYARPNLYPVNPGQEMSVTVDNAIINEVGAAAYAGYDNDGNPAFPDGARRNWSAANSVIDNGDGTSTYTFILGDNVTQVGLFYKESPVTFYFKQNESTVYSEKLDQHIQEVAGGGVTTSGDSARYYLKGSSPKSFSSAKKICILAAGQSNIDGRVPYANMPEEIQEAQPIANCHYVMNSESGAFSPLNITGNWAFDLVTYYNIAIAQELYVIKWSQGGTSIDPLGDGTNHWTADYEKLASESNSLLLKFENEIRNHIASNGDNFDIRAMLWHQGESDRASLGTGSADRYYDNLRNMISYVRGIVGNERLPIVTGTISENSAQYDATVHAAQVRLASEDPYFVLIDMSGAPLLDNYHFNAASSVYLGEMAYNALIDLGVISGTKLTPTRPW